MNTDIACNIMYNLDYKSIARWSQVSKSYGTLLGNACKEMLPSAIFSSAIFPEGISASDIIKMNTVGSEQEMVDRINACIKEWKFGESLCINCSFIDKRTLPGEEKIMDPVVQIRIKPRQKNGNAKILNLVLRNEFLPSSMHYFYAFSQNNSSYDEKYFSAPWSDLHEHIPFLSLINSEKDSLYEAVKNFRLEYSQEIQDLYELYSLSNSEEEKKLIQEKSVNLLLNALDNKNKELALKQTNFDNIIASIPLCDVHDFKSKARQIEDVNEDLQAQINDYRNYSNLSETLIKSVAITGAVASVALGVFFYL